MPCLKMSEDNNVNDNGGHNPTDCNENRDHVKSLTDLLLTWCHYKTLAEDR